MVSPSSRQAVMSKKSTSSLLERTRFTASPNWQTGMPLFVNLNSGSLVRLPARTTRLKLTILVSSFSSLYRKCTESFRLLKYESVLGHPRNLEKASRPNVARTTPETLFTQRSPPGESFVRKRPTTLLKSSHHKAEPRKTPRTSNVVER